MAKAATTAKTTNGKPAASKAVAFVDPKAISADVGLKAVKAFKDEKEAEAEISELQFKNRARKAGTLLMLTQQFAKAALADKSIHLDDYHSESKPVVSALREKLDVVIGIKVVEKAEDGTETRKLAPWTKPYFVQPGEDRTSPDGVTKETFRTNFAAAVKTAALAAHAIMIKGMVMSEDKETGALRITGKGVKEHFKVDSVVLNEKKDVKDASGKAVKLDVTPSYTELRKISTQAVKGSVITPKNKSDQKLASGKVSEKEMIDTIKALQLAVSKLASFSDELGNALEGLQTSIEEAIERNEGSEAA